MNASEIMSRKPISVTPDHSVRHAIRIMLDNHVSGLPVVNDNGALVGIITEGDLMRRVEIGTDESTPYLPNQPVSKEQALSYTKTHSWRVGDVMTQRVSTIGTYTSLNAMVRIMQVENIKRLPVLDDKSLVGMVSRSDVMTAVCKLSGDSTAAGDEAIRLAVATRIETDLGLTDKEVDVHCRNGHIRLTGTVKIEMLREAARVAAESVRGVNGVANELWVQE